jgi:hypothetical protein
MRTHCARAKQVAAYFRGDPNDFTVPNYIIGEFLFGDAFRSDALPLGGVKDGGRCELAPKAVDFDW